MIETAEARWFFEGSLPDDLRSLYQAAAIPGVLEERTDWYLVGAGQPDLGIKVRDGSWLDLKRRTDEQSDRALSDTMRGNVENWSKWSFALAADPIDVSGWLRVDKRRWIRRYEVDETGLSAAVPFDKTIESGCNAELSAVSVESTPWWSLGFEAFGPTDALELALSATVSTFLSDSPDLAGVSFGSSDSHSYPSWLAHLADV